MRYPILLSPVCKEYIWGGTNLKSKYNKSCGLDTIAESWELAAHEEGTCSIANGQYAGMLFTEYLQEVGDVLGSRAGGELPLLVKYIDTADNLSVQVHPDDAYAKKNHNAPGKTEFWYIMDCAEDAQLYYGFKQPTSREEFMRRAADGSIEEILNKMKVKPGDSFVIPPGLVHAIGKNMTVAEIGTNCNITYRIYDYGRLDAAGNPRPLHVQSAADVFRCDVGNKPWVEGKIDCGPFAVSLLQLNGILDMASCEESFQCILCVEGSCRIDRCVQLEAGGSVFIPAGMQYTMNGNATLLVVTV